MGIFNPQRTDILSRIDNLSGKVISRFNCLKNHFLELDSIREKGDKAEGKETEHDEKKRTNPQPAPPGVSHSQR